MNRSATALLEKHELHIDNAVHGRRMWDASLQNVCRDAQTEGDPHHLRQGAVRRRALGLVRAGSYLQFCSWKGDSGPISGSVTYEVQRHT
jgi:hypothetical protein